MSLDLVINRRLGKVTSTNPLRFAIPASRAGGTYEQVVTAYLYANGASYTNIVVTPKTILATGMQILVSTDGQTFSASANITSMASGVIQKLWFKAVCNNGSMGLLTSTSLQYDFTTDLQRWTLSGTGTLAWDSDGGAGAMRHQNPPAGGSYQQSPSISFQGTRARGIRARSKVNSVSGWLGIMRFSTSSGGLGAHGFSAAYQEVVAAPVGIDSGYVDLEFDMSSLTAGGANWVQSVISRIGLLASDYATLDMYTESLVIGEIGDGFIDGQSIGVACTEVPTQTYDVKTRVLRNDATSPLVLVTAVDTAGSDGYMVPLSCYPADISGSASIMQLVDEAIGGGLIHGTSNIPEISMNLSMDMLTKAERDAIWLLFSDYAGGMSNDFYVVDNVDNTVQRVRFGASDIQFSGLQGSYYTSDIPLLVTRGL